ncbi:hypothetical protein Bpfe_022989, partial [Biomphalaria pfeifferi]
KEKDTLKTSPMALEMKNLIATLVWTLSTFWTFSFRKIEMEKVKHCQYLDPLPVALPTLSSGLSVCQCCSVLTSSLS